MATERDYDKEYREYHGKPIEKKRRAQRNAARRTMEEKHGKAALKGKDVHHKRRNVGGNLSNDPSNLAVLSIKKNRGMK